MKQSYRGRPKLKQKYIDKIPSRTLLNVPIVSCIMSDFSCKFNENSFLSHLFDICLFGTMPSLESTRIYFPDLQNIYHFVHVSVDWWIDSYCKQTMCGLRLHILHLTTAYNKSLCLRALCISGSTFLIYQSYIITLSIWYFDASLYR